MAELERLWGVLTPQAAQIQEAGNLNEGQLQTVQQHMQDRFVTMQQRRGVPEVFGDGLGGAADSSFVTPQPFDVLPGFGVQQSNNHGNQQQLDVFAKSEKWLTPAPTPSEHLEVSRRRGFRMGWLFG